MKTAEGKFVCTLCTSPDPYTSSKRYNMKTHLEAKHELSQGYQCQVCYKILKTRNVLNSHMAQSHKAAAGLWQ